jgi:hypothetical protein
MYYHLSEKYHGKTVWFDPQIPSKMDPVEDHKIKRICFAPSIEKCLMAIGGYDDWKTTIITNPKQKYFVYAIHGHSKVFKPTNDLVPDIFRTDEVWRLESTRLFFKGKLKINNNGELYIETAGAVRGFPIIII